jgi:uroporphyrinogen-III decarboxylase
MIKINISTDELAMRKIRVDKANNFEKTDRPVLLCYVDIFQYLRKHGIECEDYLTSPEIHIKAQLDFQKELLENFSTDQYSINPTIDMFVTRLANAFGCDIEFIRGSLPCTRQWVKDENDLLKLEKMDVCNNGLFLAEKDFRKYALDNAKKYPVELADGNVVYPLESMKTPKFDCEGIVSTAQLLMGMEEFFIACYDRPEFVHKLLDIITNKYIEHWADLVKEFNVSEVKELILADDTATFLNFEMFEEFCIPYMKRVRNTFPEAKAMLHFCMAVPEYVDLFGKEIPINAYTGFKPRSGIHSIKKSYEPVNKLLGNKILLYPDTDPCIVETATCDEVYNEVIDILEVFKDTKGVIVSFSTWSAEKSKAGMKACEDFFKGNEYYLV